MAASAVALSSAEGILDVSRDPSLDFYLVFTGPRGPAAVSRRAHRPWVIDHVYLFEQRMLLLRLLEHGVQIGVATSVSQAVWEEAQICPATRNARLALSEGQTALLGTLGSRTGAAGVQQ